MTWWRWVDSRSLRCAIKEAFEILSWTRLWHVKETWLDAESSRRLGKHYRELPLTSLHITWWNLSYPTSTCLQASPIHSHSHADVQNDFGLSRRSQRCKQLCPSPRLQSSTTNTSANTPHLRELVANVIWVHPPARQVSKAAGNAQPPLPLILHQQLGQ